MSSAIKKILNVKVWLGILAFILLCVLWQLLWGKLFPFSPVALGFKRQELQRIIVYAQQGAMGFNYSQMDAWLPEVEDFHALKFIRKPKIYFYRDKAGYLRRNLTRARFCAYPNGKLVVSPWAQQENAEGKISLEIYLKHELSHTLLYQHMNMLTAMQYPKWLMEGVAVYSANQMGTSWYPGQAETYRLIRQGNFMPPKCFKTPKEDQIKLQVPYRPTFMYSEFACLVDYLIKYKGKDIFLVYLQHLLQGGEHDKIFKEVYGMGYDELLVDFKRFVETPDWKKAGGRR